MEPCAFHFHTLILLLVCQGLSSHIGNRQKDVTHPTIFHDRRKFAIPIGCTTALLGDGIGISPESYSCLNNCAKNGKDLCTFWLRKPISKCSSQGRVQTLIQPMV